MLNALIVIYAFQYFEVSPCSFFSSVRIKFRMKRVIPKPNATKKSPPCKNETQNDVPFFVFPIFFEILRILISEKMIAEVINKDMTYQ